MNLSNAFIKTQTFVIQGMYLDSVNFHIIFQIETSHKKMQC